MASPVASVLPAVQGRTVREYTMPHSSERAFKAIVREWFADHGIDLVEETSDGSILDVDGPDGAHAELSPARGALVGAQGEAAYEAGLLAKGLSAYEVQTLSRATATIVHVEYYWTPFREGSHPTYPLEGPFMGASSQRLSALENIILPMGGTLLSHRVASGPEVIEDLWEAGGARLSVPSPYGVPPPGASRPGSRAPLPPPPPRPPSAGPSKGEKGRPSVPSAAETTGVAPKGAPADPELLEELFGDAPNVVHCPRCGQVTGPPLRLCDQCGVRLSYP